MKIIIRTASVFVLLFVINSCLTAQVTVQNNGILGVPASGIFYINGPLINASGAALTNNGSLYVQQDITNNQVSMSAGTGTLYLNGTSMQSISGSQMFKTYNLVTNNSAGITINNNLSVSGVHTYTAGLITTSATPNYMVYEAGSSYTGDDDTRHVDGWVKKFGNTDFIFPVGNATYERTIALTNLTASSEFNVKHFDNPTPNRINLFSPIVLIDTNEYWKINKISGANAKVVMNWDNTKIPIPQVLITGIRAGYYNGTFWTNIGGTGVGAVATTGTVTSNSVSAFNNNFTIASTSWVLPLDIISFTGVRNGNYNRLNWTIGNEVNVLHYELQRSNDAVSFNTINIQQPKNSSSTEQYTYDDVAAMLGKVYYRLKCIDDNGQIKYSGIVIITATQDGRKDFYVLRNPVSDRIDIYASDIVKGTYNYTIANTAGQVVQTGILDIKNQGVYTINLQAYLSKGMYMLIVRNANNTLQKSILKE
ncbi:T9SS type A sorting domain-containing protein [Ferruginibacter sp. SUN106]|uniref:T9SS type A sorting domain-containing protein n=1 Tax=Ferruginibacter sp. SUN106 TaxID=2978348 RepID=UPI003D36BC64